MTTMTQVRALGSDIDRLSTVAFTELQSLLLAVDNVNPERVRDALLEFFPELIEGYIAASGELTAAWYEDVRNASLGTRTAGAVVETMPDRDRFDSLVRYAVSPLFDQSTSTVLSLLAGGSQRLIAGGSRDTVQANVSRERTRVGYARIPRPGCCAFCAMLGSRGAVYGSEASAGGVVGRGVDASVTRGKRGGQGKGVRPRGERALGNDYHDFCRCVVAPVFVGDTFAKESAEQMLKFYEPDGEINKDGYRVTTAKATLAEMRKVHGLR